MQERWLPVPEWAATHEVSSRGQVRSLPRVLANGRRHGGQLLAQGTDRKGYRTVTLTDGKRRRTVRVHVLMMLAFEGAPPPGKPQVRHLNGKPWDNRWPRNLAYGDQADQEADKASLRARRASSRRRRESLNGDREKTEARSEKSNSSRALATVPQTPLSPAAAPVSAQDATGRETASATGLRRRS